MVSLRPLTILTLTILLFGVIACSEAAPSQNDSEPAFFDSEFPLVVAVSETTLTGGTGGGLIYKNGKADPWSPIEIRYAWRGSLFSIIRARKSDCVTEATVGDELPASCKSI